MSDDPPPQPPSVRRSAPAIPAGSPLWDRLFRFLRRKLWDTLPYRSLNRPWGIWKVTQPTSIDDIEVWVVARSEEEVWTIVDREDLRNSHMDLTLPQHAWLHTKIERVDWGFHGVSDHLYVVKS